MKKGTTVFLLVFVCFLCVMAGTFIGRSTSKNHYFINANSATNPNSESVNQTAIGLLDINTAAAADFADLPGIGEVLAQRILDYRALNGPFACVDDLLMVEGLGEKRLEDIRKFITVGGQYEDTCS